MKYIITGEDYTSQLVYKCSNDVKVLSEKELIESNIRFNESDKVYVPSESALEIVIKRSDDKHFIEAVNSLKDKFKFRTLMSKMYPDFFYKQISVDDLKYLDLEDNKKYIVKPVKGFFGTAVKEINRQTDLNKISQEIVAELAKNTKYFSESVLSKNQLIVEQYIGGEEFAIDLYYDEDGSPQILNIYQHPFPENQEYFHVLYYTNKSLFDKFLDYVSDIFIELNSYLKISKFPIHAEFKYENGTLIPIEMNPLRYGGFGLADLTFHAFDIHPFNAFFENCQLDWQKIWETRKGQNFGWVLGYNGKNKDMKIHQPNHQKFKDYLVNTIEYIPINHQENPVFSISYVKNRNLENLLKILQTEFDDFFG